MSTTDPQVLKPSFPTTGISVPIGLQRKWLVAALLWLAVTSGFVAFRNFPFYVWNDTPSIMHHESSGIEDLARTIDGRREELLAKPVATTFKLASDAFRSIQGGGYRPLSTLQSLLLAHLIDIHQPALLHLWVWGAVYGFFGVALWRVSVRYLGDSWWSLVPVLLTLGSPPVVGAGLVLVAGFQLIVPLTMCLALLFYWHATDGNRGWKASVVLLAILLLLGPWYREVLVVLPFLLGCIEYHRAGRITALHTLFAAALLHALFPTALVKVVAFPDLPLTLVTKIGLANQQLQTGIRWYAAWSFLPLVPPTLLVFGIVAGLWSSVIAVRSLFQRKWRFAFETLFHATAVLWASTTIFLLFRWNSLQSEEAGTHFSAILMLGLPMAVLRRHPSLALWFGVTFLPVLRVFAEHVHFMYAIVPTSIILVAAVQDFHGLLPRTGIPALTMRWSIVSILAIATTDQCCNIPAGHSVAESQYRGMHQIARALMKTLPKNSVLITNVIHGVEIGWLTDSHFDLRTSVSAGVAPRWSVESVPTMTGILESRAGSVYLLDCNFEYLPNKQYHRHKYIHAYHVDKEDLGTLHQTSARYYFADPLRHFISRRYMPFLGAPDLENDFYTGPSRRSRFFESEMYAEYRLFRVTGQTLTPNPNALDSTTLVMTHKTGMNVLQNGNNYFAIPVDQGPFDVQKFIERRYSRQFSDPTLEGLCRLLDDSGGDAVVSAAEGAVATLRDPVGQPKRR